MLNIYIDIFYLYFITFCFWYSIVCLFGCWLVGWLSDWGVDMLLLQRPLPSVGDDYCFILAAVELLISSIVVFCLSFFVFRFAFKMLVLSAFSFVLFRLALFDCFSLSVGHSFLTTCFAVFFRFYPRILYSYRCDFCSALFFCNLIYVNCCC